ncbi:hypothetical protein HOLleu_03919 [Holothuria leucospilota]|uniref:G domain-containing protein n=1 Tax=Holothuria leucospilota TaxID=206669 RepID=A0A9Q1HHX1_HOLLE|nr:hypothetical protein HOLleu_03919 [Holothuria leucospilota]
MASSMRETDCPGSETSDSSKPSLVKGMKNLLTPSRNILRIMSVGKSGVGKSTIGNMLLQGKGKGDFKTSKEAKSCTQEPRHRLSCTGDCEYTDVPGIPDTNPSKTAEFYDMIIKEAKKELTVILFVFKRERVDPVAYKLAEMLFRELNKSSAAKILVINDQTNYAFEKTPPTEDEYEAQVKAIQDYTKIKFTHTVVVNANTMKEKMKILKIMLSEMKSEKSEHLKSFSELREYVDELRKKKNYEEEVVRQEWEHIASIKEQLEGYQNKVVTASTVAALATVASFFTFGATLGIGTPTAMAAAAATAAIQIKKAELEEAEKRISTDNVERAAEELRIACEKFQELQRALKV